LSIAVTPASLSHLRDGFPPRQFSFSTPRRSRGRFANRPCASPRANQSVDIAIALTQNVRAGPILVEKNYAGVEDSMSQRSELIATLNAMVAERSLLKHPFYQEWTAGSLSLDRLRNYAAQYYRHVEAFPRYLSALHSRCEDLQTRQALLDNLIDEERGAENHPELWLRFAEGLGVARKSVLASAPSPSTRTLVDTFTRLAREAPVASGLAALYVYEAQIPPVAATKIGGLRQFYGIGDDRSLSFFTVHQQADVYHAQTTARLLERHSATADEAHSALEGADAALGALWTMLDGV
jgi:pyrroloquinoline-quinone synthase